MTFVRRFAEAFGPILRRELLTASRRRATFIDRSVYGLVFLVALGAGTAWWDHNGRDRSTLAGQAWYGSLAFGVAMGFGVMIAFVSVPNVVAPVVAVERERKTLDALLATRLRSAEVVLGALAAGLANQLNGLAVVLSFGVMSVPAWGVDPRLVVLCFAGLVATVLFVAALSIAASVEQPTARRALASAYGTAFAWLFFPSFCRLVLPLFWRRGAAAIAPLTDVLLESSPFGPAVNVGLLRSGTLAAAVPRMIGWELAGSAAVLLWAIARLRPASRGLYDDETRSLIRRLTSPSRPGRRRPCGDDPVLWRELTRRRSKTPVGRAVDRLVLAGLLAVVAAAILWVAVPAFREVLALGYGPSPAGTRGADDAIHINPFARLLVAGLGLSAPPGTCRLELNGVVRPFFAVYLFSFVIAITGATVELFCMEGERDTWAGLLATPLTGGRILRAKLLGAVWQTRWYTGTTLAICLVGLLCGGLHPLGFAYGLTLLAVTAWFFGSVGAYAWLRFPDRQRAMAAAVFPALLLTFGGAALATLVPWPLGVPSMATSTPMIGWMGLVSYDDVAAAFRSGAFPSLPNRIGQAPSGAWRVAAACLIGLALQAAGAFVLTRKAVREFDALVGRPVRPREEPFGGLTPGSALSTMGSIRPGSGTCEGV